MNNPTLSCISHRDAHAGVQFTSKSHSLGVAHLGALLGLAALFATLALALGRTPASARGPSVTSEPSGINEHQVICTAELRSWIVAGRGRHLYLLITAPAPFEDLSGRVEYTTIALRSDYDPWSDPSGRPRIGRMTPGRTLSPLGFGPIADNRLEARYEITAAQARRLQQDRVFTEAYALLGANSSSGLRMVMEEVGLRLPDHVLRAGGALGEFPGVEFDPGPEVPRSAWAAIGLTGTQPGRERPAGGE